MDRFGAMILGVIAMGACSRPDPHAVAVRADLERITETVRASHPMPAMEPERFEALLQRATRAAEAELGSASTERAYRRVVQRFVATFEDPHLHVSEPPEEADSVWPGFVISARGDRFVVVGQAPGLAAGTTLVSCDGRSLRAWLDESVLPYETGSRHGFWDDVANAPRITVGVQGDALPQVCVDAAGASHRLVYAPAGADDLLRARWTAAYGQPAYVPGISAVEGGLWVRLPTFDLDGDPAQRMHAVIEQLSADPQGFVVLDVRGNTGGSDAWGRRVVRALWGVDRPMSAKAVHWRVSAENRDWIRDRLVPHAAKADERESRALAGVAEAMEAALATEQQLIVEELTSSAPTPADPPQAQIVLLTDAACSSSCLLFADRVLSLPGVLHLGEPTGADTTYTEVRWTKLPSGAELTLPIKALSGRKRAPHVGYTPSAVYTGDRSDADVRRWVLAQMAAL